MNPPALRNGEPWPDTDGRPINAHGGGFLVHGDQTYWYGECRPAGPSTLNSLIGVSCYSSFDLVAWKNEGVVLLVVDDDDTHPLATGCKIERPKVAHCRATGKFVMWWHHDLKGWGHAGAYAGVAVADAPTGPFVFREILKPLGAMFRDCTLFVDDDQSAHLVFATDDNCNLALCRLSDDYLHPVGPIHRVFLGRYMEAPCVFKHDGTYYFIGSDCTSWDPNEARSAWAPTLHGPWREYGNPCTGDGAEITYGAQSTYVLPQPGAPGRFVFMADLWQPQNLADSRYLWLPLKFRSTIQDWPPRPLIARITN